MIRRIALAVITLIAIVFAAPLAPASAPSGAGVFDPSSPAPQPVHGWTVTQDAELRDWVLIHVPPRRPAPGGTSFRAAQDGTARGVVRLKDQPIAIASLGSTAYVAFRARQANALIPIMSVTALRSRGDLWGYSPPSRLESCAALPAPNSALLGLVGTSQGLLALTQPRPEKDAADRPHAMHLMRQGEWASVTPALPESAPGTPQLVHAADGAPMLALWTGSQVTLWQGAFTYSAVPASPQPVDQDAPRLTSPAAPREVQVVKVEWKSVGTFSLGAYAPAKPSQPSAGKPAGLSTDSDSAPSSAPEIITIGRLGDEPVVYVLAPSPDPARARVCLRLTSAGPVLLTSLEGVGETFSAIPLVDADRLVVLSPTPPAAKAKAAPAPVALTHVVREYSLLSGRQWYSGPARNPNPITSGDFRIVVAALILLMGMVLFVVLRPNKSPESITLPEDAALAEPTRRFIAGLIDLAAAVIIGSRLAGLDISDLFLLSSWLSDQAMLTVACIAGFGFVAGTVGEALTGRSLGKLVTGCEVISILNPEQPDLSLNSAIIRNAIKWGLPPVAVLGLFDPGLRHKGDDLARSAVVIWTYPEDEEE